MGVEVLKSETFCYLESIPQKNGESKYDENHRIKAQWMR